MIPLKSNIGGFFELELPKNSTNYHSSGLGLSNGRTCLRVILREIKASKIYVPFYSCNSLLVPFTTEGVEIIFYPIDECFEPLYLPDLKSNEFFLYINYFGLKTKCAVQLVQRYRHNTIIDNTQSYFVKGYEYGWSFNSARKYFGVPDGGYLYSPYVLNCDFERNKNYIPEHLILRLDERQLEAFEYFKRNEELQNDQFFKISKFAEAVLAGIDYNWVAAKRRENFNFCHKNLKRFNQIPEIEVEDNDIPFFYPFLSNVKLPHSLFHADNIYLSFLWKEVIARGRGDEFIFEKEISHSILPLPIDHRYNEADLVRILNLITESI